MSANSRDLLSAKDSPEVAKENQDERAVLDQRAEGALLARAEKHRLVEVDPIRSWHHWELRSGPSEDRPLEADPRQ